MGHTHTIRDQVRDVLRSLSITTIFGNPGSTEEDFLQDFPSDFRYVLCLQEAAAVAMADGYAQATGHPALVNLHTHVGTGNAMASIISAYQNKTPLIITAGQQTRQMMMLEPWLANVDATMLPRPYVKWSHEPLRAEDVPAAFLRAFATAIQPPAGPTYLSLPMDDWDKPAGSLRPAPRKIDGRPGLPQDSAMEIARVLNEADNPVLILGAGIDRSQAWDDATRLAERLRCPVWAAPASERGVFPEDNPQFRGFLPFAIEPLAHQLRGHDVALVGGAPVFRYYPYVPGEYIPAGMRLILVTDDPSEAARAPVGDAYVADAKLACITLLPLLAQSERVLPGLRPSEEVPADSKPMSADALYNTVDTVRPLDAIVVQESNSNLGALHRRIPITRPMSYFATASAGLGWGLAAAIGIALAERDRFPQEAPRPVIAIIGDGAFQYSIQSLWTAVQYGIPLTVLIPINQEYAILKSFAVRDENPGVPGLDLPALDVVALARAYGCRAARIDEAEELIEALSSALKERGRPSVLGVPITPDVPPLL